MLAGTALGEPKHTGGVAASLRQLRAARQAANQLRALLLDAPEPLHALRAQPNPATVATLLIAAGDNPTACAARPGSRPCVVSARCRLHQARPDGTGPDRGGDRQANRALHVVVHSRMQHDPRTRAYVQRRTKQGLSRREIMRCLKRDVARELFHLLPRPHVDET